MENQQQNTVAKKQKDYWKEAYKNFLHLSYLAGAFLIISLFMYAKGSSESFDIFSILQPLIFTIAWYYLSQLFKKHSKSAIKTAYIILGILLVLMLLNGINIIGLFILYLFYVVYKASKVSTN